jgi:hypothetical protein
LNVFFVLLWLVIGLDGTVLYDIDCTKLQIQVVVLLWQVRVKHWSALVHSSCLQTVFNWDILSFLNRFPCLSSNVTFQFEMPVSNSNGSATSTHHILMMHPILLSKFTIVDSFFFSNYLLILINMLRSSKKYSGQGLLQEIF